MINSKESSELGLAMGKTYLKQKTTSMDPWLPLGITYTCPGLGEPAKGKLDPINRWRLLERWVPCLL